MWQTDLPRLPELLPADDLAPGTEGFLLPELFKHPDLRKPSENVGFRYPPATCVFLSMYRS